MRHGTFQIRAARPDELEELGGIDDDSAELFKPLGLDFGTLTSAHPYVINETARWLDALSRGWALLAHDTAGRSAGFIILDLMDGQPYLEQLSVRMRAMRRGLGTALLRCAIDWARQHGDVLWLNTYGHVAWNRPYYERHGFVVVPEPECGPEMLACLAEQRAALPAPDQRVAMRRPLSR